jgi:nicotinate-nucleotide pyrophosphorylase (carboxylating)
MQDGAVMKKGDIAFHLHGDEKSILRAERLILNFMQRMSGIATNTARYVAAIEGTKAPRISIHARPHRGCVYSKKWAVKMDGGHNHREGLYDNDHAEGQPY